MKKWMLVVWISPDSEDESIGKWKRMTLQAFDGEDAGQRQGK